MRFDNVEVDRVNRATQTIEGAAGKSVNVAKVLKILGETPLATGFSGGSRGAFVQRALENLGVATEFVQVAGETRECITVIDLLAGTQTELVEESPPADFKAFIELLGIIEQQIASPNCQAMILSGTVAPGGPSDFYLRCSRLAEEHKVLTVVDAQGSALLETLPNEPGLVKPNLKELADSLNREITGESDALEAMQELHQRGARNVLVTAGSAASLAFDGRSAWRVRNPVIEVVNPIGSGDAFTAGLVCQLVRGASLGEACRWGAAAGAANALTLMAGDLDRAEFERLLPQVEVELLG